ncbi:hypothetical protein ACFTZK_01575 [Streptomyces decoyicus]|uniref:hypothetical protein n=1 Tax=Streptomyces decoyicus TaxID=249567 RepID=UPI00363E7FB5
MPGVTVLPQVKSAHALLAVRPRRGFRRLDRLREAISQAEAYNAVKADAEPAVLKLLDESGCCFDVANPGEIDLFLAADADRGLCCKTPVAHGTAPLSPPPTGRPPKISRRVAVCSPRENTVRPRLK